MIISKILKKLKDGTLFSAVKRKMVSKIYGRFSDPIGDNYTGFKADVYDSHRIDDQYWSAENESLQYALRKLPNLQNVLDAPFGTGRFLPYYVDHGLSVIALDISDDMLNQARVKYPEQMSQVKVLLQDMNCIPLPTNSVDLVVCYRFLPWIVSFSEAEIALRELSRVCNGYAVLELCVGVHADGEAKIYPNKTLWNRMNESELVAWLAKFNLVTLEVVKLYDDAEHPGLSMFLCNKSTK